MKIFDKMIEHPIATVFIMGALVDGISVLAHNMNVIFKK